jgi:hypothetical protein
MNKLKKIQDEQKKLAAKMEEEETMREKELQVRETYGYSTRPVFEDQRKQYESSSNRRRDEKSRNEDRHQERRPRNRSVDRNEEKMEQYERRRQRRPSDIERKSK